MKFLKRIFNRSSKEEKNISEEKEEVWQWQINCAEEKYTNQISMPKNFGLIIGTKKDCEERLEKSVSINGRIFKSERDVIGSIVKIYTFYNLDENPVGQQIKDFQIGAIRRVSTNLKLATTYPYEDKFLVEEKIIGSEFDFYPIKPSEKLTKGERKDDSET